MNPAADDDDILAGPEAFEASVRIEDMRWQGSNPAGIAGQVLSALATSPEGPEGEAACDILFADDATLADLNERFRGKTGTTNVLSFPSGEPFVAGEPLFLGGIALAYGQTEREASERGIPFAHHATHLTLHGILHLLGHDHIVEAEREEMERIEIELLETMGVPNPYEGS